MIRLHMLNVLLAWTFFPSVCPDVLQTTISSHLPIKLWQTPVSWPPGPTFQLPNVYGTPSVEFYWMRNRDTCHVQYNCQVMLILINKTHLFGHFAVGLVSQNSVGDAVSRCTREHRSQQWDDGRWRPVWRPCRCKWSASRKSRKIYFWCSAHWRAILI